MRIKKYTSFAREITKFGMSSVVSFILDYGMYCLFNGLTGNILLSNVLARIISATANYTLNRKFVFQSNASVARSLIQYAALAAFILTCNTLLLKFITDAGLNRYIAKLAVECVMFSFSWFIQHKVIFRKKKK